MTSTASALPETILSGATADVYFLRTQEALQREGINPRVTMEVFSAQGGVLCGVGEALELLRQVLPTGSEVWSLDDGDEIGRKEVVLRIAGPYLSFGLYETAILGYLSHETGWATAARECVRAAQGIPVVSFGARHVHPLVAPLLDYAAVVGGAVSCSTPEGARLAGVEPSGTMPHAMILAVGDTLRAARVFDRHMPPEVPRIVLVDTFRDEAEEALAVAHALGERLSGIRLDTPGERGGVTIDLIKEVRARLDLEGFSHVQIFVSGGVTPDRIRSMLEAGAQVNGFGVGSYISGAPPNDFTADIKEVEGRPLAKRGRIPGLTANPRLQRVL